MNYIPGQHIMMVGAFPQNRAGKTHLSQQLLDGIIKDTGMPVIMIDGKQEFNEIPVFCATCYDPVRYSPEAKAWFHKSGGKEFGTIAREITTKPLTRSRPVMPAPKDTAAGFTVPKINGRSTQIRILP